MANVWINEFHYDNSSTDAGEFIEIAGPAGTDLTGYAIVLYNGNGGTPYNTRALTGVIPDQENGFGTLAFVYPVDGIQNGGVTTTSEPDAIALVRPDGTIEISGGVVQFLSYEGIVTATAGPAAGLTSTNIGVAEPGNDPSALSLQLTGAGDDYNDLSWAGPAEDSPGTINVGQTLSSGIPAITIDDVTVSETNDAAIFTITLSEPSTQTVTVAYATADQKAVAGEDYTAVTGTLTFEPGAMVQTITVPVLDDVTVPEGGETFTILLLDPINTRLADASGQGSIVDDDSEPVGTVTISDVSVIEGSEGTTQAVFTVARAGGTAAFSVDYGTSDLTASANSDYTAV